MAKSWAEVAESKAYQALPDEEKSTVQEQYFNSVVAPKVPEQDRDAVREQFLSSTAPKKAASAKTSSAETPELEAMQQGMSAEDVAAQQPKGKSIFERGVKMEPPSVDAQKNLEAMRRSGSPESVMFTPGRRLEAVDTQIARYKARQESFNQREAEKAAKARATLEQRDEAEGYSPVDLAKDVGVGLVGKGGTGLAQSVAGLGDIATGWIPGDENINPLQIGQWGKMMDKLGVDFDASNKFLTGLQSPRMQLQLGNVDKAEGFFGTIKELGANPLALLDAVTSSLIPSIVAAGSAGGAALRMWVSKASAEAAERGLVGKAAEEYIRNRALTAATLTAHAAEGTLSAGAIAEQARAQGMDWEDYVAPAVSAGVGTALIGYGAGKLGSKLGIGDVETDIAARTAGLKGLGVTKGPALTGFFKEITKEGFLEEMPQSAQEQIFTNLATDRPWNEGVDKAAAQGLMAGLATAGGHNAVITALRQNATEVSPMGAPTTSEQAAEQPTAAEQVEAPEAAAQEEQPAPETAVQEEQVAPAQEQVQEEQAPAAPSTIDDMAEQIAIERGIPLKNAKLLAQRRLDEAKADRIQELADTYVELGLPPKLAKEQAAIDIAKEEAEANATAEGVTTGEADVGQPINEPSGVGAELAGQPDQVRTAEGFGEPATDGVVPAGEDAVPATEGAGVEPTALTPEPEITIEPAFRTTKGGRDVADGYDVFINGEWGNRYRTKKEAQAAVQAARAEAQAKAAEQAAQPTEGAQVGTETTEAVQAETQGQEAPTADAGVTAPVAEGELKEDPQAQKLDDAYSRAEFIVNRSNTPASLLKGISTMRATQQAKYYFNKAMAFGPDFMYLANGVKNSLPALTTTYELTGKMSGMAADFLRAAGLMQKRVDDYLIKNPDKKDSLSRVIYMSTVMRYDPANPKNKRRQVDMDRQFAELGEEGQKIYVALRDYYRDTADYYNDLLLELVENLGIDPNEKKNLAVLLRKEYEASKRITPYFPLVRLGNFWVRVGTGEDRELYTFESAGERDEFAQGMAEEFGGDLDTLIGEGTFAVGTQLNFRNEGSKGNAMLTALFDAIEKQPVAPTADGKAPAVNPNEALKNVVFQAYLSAMPEQSFRKQFLERQDIPGFSTDITKNIAHTATKQALQLARLKYTPEIRKSLEEAKRSLKYQQKGYELLPYVDEAEKRVNAILSSDHQGALESVVTGINQVSYVWLLSGPATALMDLINVPTRGLAVLTANHPGKGAVKELAKATAMANRITEKRLHKNAEGVPTMLDDPSLSDEMRYAIGELMRSGVTQMTEVESLEYIGAKTTDINAGPIKKTAQKLTRGASLATLGFSHYMSKLTREIVFTASYNLSRREGKKPDEAIRIAIADTKEALGDFAVSNRPRYMQGELGRLAFNLKSFLVNTLLFEAVNLKRMIKADSKEEQVAAAKKFLGLWATTALALGQPATPLYTVIMSTLGLVFEFLKGKHEDDWPEDMLAMSFEKWYRTVWIPEHLGNGLGGFINHGLLGYTGWDLTYRASLDVVKQLMDWTESLTPPGISVMANMVDGLRKWHRGEVEEGTKKMLPAIMRGPYITAVMATQGALDSKGNLIADARDIKMYEYAGQVLGFSPRVIGQIKRDNYEFFSMEKEIVKERFDLLDRLDIADRRNDHKLYRKTYEEIDKFNRRYAGYKIDLQDMVDSADERARKRAMSYRGIELTKKNEYMLGRAADSTRKELAERTRKRKEATAE